MSEQRSAYTVQVADPALREELCKAELEACRSALVDACKQRDAAVLALALLGWGSEEYRARRKLWRIRALLAEEGD